MDGVLGHMCAHIGEIGSGETTEDVGMTEMTLPADTGLEIRSLGV